MCKLWKHLKTTKKKKQQLNKPMTEIKGMCLGMNRKENVCKNIFKVKY